MSAISDFCNTIRSWLNLGPEVYADPLVTSWVRMAEEYLSENLRVKHMLQIDSSSIIDNRVLLPSDLQELDSIRFAGSKPLIYKPRGYFYAKDYSNTDRYTIIGNYLVLDGVDEVNGTPVEISYYQSIPPLEEGPNWLLQYYSRLYVVCTLWHASMYAIEDDRGESWGAATKDFVSDMNTRHQVGKAAGSALISKRRSFG